jgi:hypothetical protein
MAAMGWARNSILSQWLNLTGLIADGEKTEIAAMLLCGMMFLKDGKAYEESCRILSEVGSRIGLSV